MKNKKTITYSLLSIAGICAVVAIVFAASAVTAHGQMYYQPSYYQNSIIGSCYSNPTSVSVGGTVNWYARATGGNGVYTFTWTGDEGLSGFGSSILKNYYNPGTKYASVIITSGNQTTTVNCGNPVNVYPVYNNYYSPVYNVGNLQVTCSTNNGSNISVGAATNWFATVTGGNGSYGYSWSGTDGLYGYSQNISYVYNTPGIKTASVTVTSNNQTVSVACVNAASVSYQGGYNNSYNQVVYTNPSISTISNSNNASGLNIDCYADPSSSSINQPVTWSAQVTGGLSPYAYSWTGTDGLSGTQSSAIKYYSTSGNKAAILSVTSADGKTGTRACSSSLTVRSAGGTVYHPVDTQTNVQATASAAQGSVQSAQNNNQLSASSGLSLDNIPWGWIAILIILVLFFTVLYLLFNRQKI